MKLGYGQFCPVAVACEVFAQRWTPIILRELLVGTRRFNDIHRGMPLISRALLSKRLRELEGAGVIRRVSSSKRVLEYQLTEAGAEFHDVLESLGKWGQRWTVRVDPRNLDAAFLMWNIHRRIAKDRLPPGRTVVRFDFRGIPAAYQGFRVFWLLLERTEVTICVQDPGFEVDLFVDADLASMARVWLGDVRFADVVRARLVELEGPPKLVRQFPSWLLLSHFADVPRPKQPLIAHRSRSRPSQARGTRAVARRA